MDIEDGQSGGSDQVLLWVCRLISVVLMAAAGVCAWFAWVLLK